MKSFLHFIQYHNFAPLFFGFLILSAGVTFAANEDARGLVVSSEARVISVDNSYIVATDLDTYPFNIMVEEITEDDTNYYVAYTFFTISLFDGVWQDVEETEVLQVSKAALRGRDLGLYVEKELAEIRASEIAFLKETQVIEQGIGATSKVVATEYSGLLGRMLDSTTEVFPGYEPVVKPEEPTETPPSSQLALGTTESKTPNQGTPEGEEDTRQSSAEVNPDTSTSADQEENQESSGSSGGGGGNSSPEVVDEEPPEEPAATSTASTTDEQIEEEETSTSTEPTATSTDPAPEPIPEEPEEPVEPPATTTAPTEIPEPVDPIPEEPIEPVYPAEEEIEEPVPEEVQPEPEPTDSEPSPVPPEPPPTEPAAESPG